MMAMVGRSAAGGALNHGSSDPGSCLVSVIGVA